MAIEVKCPACAKVFKIAEWAEGKKAACPHCSTLMVVGRPKPVADLTPKETQWTPGSVFPVFAGHTGEVKSVAFSAGGTIAISAGDDGTIRFWDISTGRETMRLTGHSGPVNSAALTANGTYAVSGGADRTVRIWHVAKAKCVRVLEGHTDAVTAAAFYPLGGYAFSASMDGTVRTWELANGRCAATWRGHNGSVTSLAIDPAGRFALTGGVDATARLWRCDKGKETGRLKGHGGPIRAVAINSDGAIALTASDDRTAAVWSVSRQKALKVLKGHVAAVSSAALSHDNSIAATGGADWSLRIWNVDTATATYVLEAEEQKVTAVAFQPNGWQVLAGYGSGGLRLWNAQAGVLVRTLGGTEKSIRTCCPSCTTPFDLAARLVDEEGECPYCNRKFTARIYSSEKSQAAAKRAAEALQANDWQRAMRDFDEAVLDQCDNYEAILHAMACRNHIGEDLAQAARYADGAKLLDEAVRLFAGVKSWPLALHGKAKEEAYRAGFLAGKLNRYHLGDLPRAVEYLQFAQKLNNTLDVQDMLAHINLPPDKAASS
jgi:WD40 repeat protein